MKKNTWETVGKMFDPPQKQEEQKPKEKEPKKQKGQKAIRRKHGKNSKI